MATSTYNLIASQTVGSGGASSVVFSSIPTTYTDLLIKCSTRTTYTGGSSGLYIVFNSINTGYYDVVLYGTGASASSFKDTNQPLVSVGGSQNSSSTSNTFASTDIYIPNYLSGNPKSISGETGVENNSASTGVFTAMHAGLMNNSAAISSITITCDASFVQYSTFYLYGIKNS